MSTKSLQLQIRLTTHQKKALRRQARAAGLDLSSYVLSRVLPAERDRFAELVGALRAGDDARYVLAELNDFLHACAPSVFGDAVERPLPGSLSPWLQNYVAAMVEQAAGQKGVGAPDWVRDVAPLDAPHFATSMRSVRLHLLRSAPVPFKRRNIFVDSGVGSRV